MIFIKRLNYLHCLCIKLRFGHSTLQQQGETWQQEEATAQILTVTDLNVENTLTLK